MLETMPTRSYLWKFVQPSKPPEWVTFVRSM